MEIEGYLVSGKTNFVEEQSWITSFGAFGSECSGGPAGQTADAEEIGDAVAFARGKLGFEPDEQQMAVLRGGKRGILNCTRQWGKSTVAAAKAVHRAYTEAGSLTLLLSPSGRQSGEFIRKAREFVGRLGLKTKGDGYNKWSIVLKNGSRIIGLPENPDKVRGFSNVSLLLIDEAALVSDKTYDAVRPMLAASDGDLWLLSTPNGKRGFFWEEFANGGEEWERIVVTAEECARIKKHFLERERRSRPERSFRQEYLCEFLERDGAAFSQESIDAAYQEYEAWKL